MQTLLRRAKNNTSFWDIKLSLQRCITGRSWDNSSLGKLESSFAVNQLRPGWPQLAFNSWFLGADQYSNVPYFLSSLSIHRLCCQQLWEPSSYQLRTFATSFRFAKHCMTSSLRHPSNLFYCLRMTCTANASEQSSFLASLGSDINVCSTSNIIIMHGFGAVSIT